MSFWSCAQVVFVSREEQLRMKSGDANGEQPGTARGRGKGRGRGRGRGRSRGRGQNDLPEAKSSRKKPERRKASKSWDSDPAWDWSQEHDANWVDEWGEEWDYQGWGTTEKCWDGYAWYSSKADAHSLASGIETETKAKKSKGKGAVPAAREAEEGSKPKKQKGVDAEKPPKQSGAEESAEPKKRGVEKKESGAPKRKKSKGAGQEQSREQQIDDMVAFGESFADMDDAYDDARITIREKLPKRESCHLNIYKPPRIYCGVKLKGKGGKDFAHFNTGASPGVPDTLRMAITCKAADMLVPRLQTVKSIFELHLFFLPRLASWTSLWAREERSPPLSRARLSASRKI